MVAERIPTTRRSGRLIVVSPTKGNKFEDQIVLVLADLPKRLFTKYERGEHAEQGGRIPVTVEF